VQQKHVILPVNEKMLLSVAIKASRFVGFRCTWGFFIHAERGI